jgi:hypothetical protein
MPLDPEVPDYPTVTEHDMVGPHNPADLLPGDVDLADDPDEADEDDDVLEDEQ